MSGEVKGGGAALRGVWWGGGRFPPEVDFFLITTYLDSFSCRLRDTYKAVILCYNLGISDDHFLINLQIHIHH